MSSATRIAGGSYELIEKAGVGGMATVWRARLHGESGFTRTVAIKRLHPWVADQESGIEAFLREASLVSELSHPNIVQVHDFVQDPSDGRFLIVLEWVEGLDLGCYLRTCHEQQNPPPWPVMVSIVVDVLAGLSAAHGRHRIHPGEAPIYHRDISPSNVLVAVSGLSKLADFGMAQAMDRVTTTQPGVLKGKMSYMAPEYLTDGKATAATDLFAVGIMLWEGLAGRRLRTNNDHATLLTDASDSVPFIGDVRQDLPVALAAAVKRAVARAPQERFDSAHAMAVTLKRLLHTEAPDFNADDAGRHVRDLLPKVRRDAEGVVEESGEFPPGSMPPLK